MKRSDLKPALVLIVICIASALLLSSLNLVTAPIISERQKAETVKSLVEVLPNGKNFVELTIDEKYPAAVTSGYKADGGFVFQTTVKGKESGLVILCGIDAEGKIAGTKVIADKETDTYDVKVFPLVEGTDGKYKGMSFETFEPFLVADATLTSTAYSEAVKASLQAFIIANGGNVDLRTPEQILQDNCNTALGTTDVKFTKWFATEVITGVDAVYEAEGNVGRVFVIGEEFIAINASGKVVTTDAKAENVATATACNSVITASSLTELTTLPEGIDTDIVTKAFVTGSGNYLFELKTNGYKKLNYHYKTDHPIFIKLSISADGRIIDCLTTKQNESDGIGDVCATEEYCNQYKGATDDDIKISSELPTKEQDHNKEYLIPEDTTDIGAISGATFTTYGYQTAVKAAFAAFEILTGGAENE